MASSQMHGTLMCPMTGNVHFDDVIQVMCAWLPHHVVTHRFSGGGYLKLCEYPFHRPTFNLFIYEDCKDSWFPS